MASGNVSGGNPFDPCRQWLGITALELDDPRKLLGLDSVDDPIRILQAAEARLAHLQSVQAGPYEVARRALVARVEEARDRLLSAASTAGLPAAPAPPGSLTMPPSPTADSNVTPMPGTLYPPAAYPHAPVHPHATVPGHATGSPGYAGFPPAAPGSAAYPPHPEPGLVPGFPTPLQHPAPGAPYDGLRGTGPIYRRSSSNGPLMLLVGALFTVVAALALFALQSPPSKPVAPKPSVAKQPVVKRPSTTSRPTEPERRVASRERVRENRPDVPEREMEPEEKQPRAASPKDDPAPPDEPKNPPRPRDDDSEPETEPSPSPAPSPPPPQRGNSEPTTPTEPPTAQAPETPPETPMKKPEPPPADEPDVLAKIDDAVKRCLEAVSRREYDTAERAMKAVEGIAPEKREANRIAGWLQLVMYAKGFYDYRDQAIAAMKPGDEYDVKSKKIAVVDVNDEAVTVKVAGQQKAWPRDDIPGAVVQAVVESWFDANPANQLYLGAYHFTKPEPDLEQAEACWSKAMIGGADASLLIPLLTDPVVVDAVEP